MSFLVLQTSDGKTGIVVIAFNEIEAGSGLADSPVAYHHIRLTECFPNVEDLLHEHVVVTTASSDRGDELNDIIENRLAIDRVIENVQVCVLTSDIIQKLHTKPAASHMFYLGDTMPAVVVLLGGQNGLERWMAENLEHA